MSTSSSMETNPRRCAACKYLRRRCSQDCILAPYFPASHPERYACVHRIFGASNVTRVLQHLPVQERGQAANTMAMEAYWRVQDPVYGCTGVISRLQEEICAVQYELARTQAQIAMGSTTAHAQQQAVETLSHHHPQQQNDHSVVQMQAQYSWTPISFSDF